ncbi:diguanylate cyclase [Sphingobium sp. Leaf26]|uniref:diguanylate cyclase n=1 Tax=Sphingobium sp. Leaf26 TaxID=1735693 RepID=UPI0007005D36|nr:diguanylate cyclase [Sphingobium sp. Leaf26]KQN05397.1 diguanylate cyclase [Sphingobium sp. Leaf26]
MFNSLSTRIAAFGALVFVAVLSLIWMLVDASIQTRDSFRWVSHSAEVIETMDDALSALREAESGQRGFVLTRNASFADPADARVAVARDAMVRLDRLTADNPTQNMRARELRSLMDRRMAMLSGTLADARMGDYDKARTAIASGAGRDLMTMLTLRIDSFLAEERALRLTRIDAADRRLGWVRQLALVGGPIVALAILSVSLLLIWGIRRPAGVISRAMTALGEGDRSTRVTTAMGSREFARLASGYNAMADQLQAAVADQGRSEQELKAAHGELLRNSNILRERGEVIELLGGMAHRMQAARTDEELAQVIRVFMPRVLPGIPGALYAHNNSRNLLVPITGWSGFTPAEDGFAPDQCWALRRGQSHCVTQPGGDIVCGHVDRQAIYHCEPLLAGGEVIGTLYLEGVIGEESGFRLTVMAENISSALVNHRLQRGLREQTIRDPLTGLFNRRYMEEALTIEIARARRSAVPLSAVMCDVDHFKRFNDEFGHEAGDVVLQAVAHEMRSRFRDGDIVCRYGGEEFAVIAPGTTAQALAGRVEDVRKGIAEIVLRHGGRALGSTSMSFGIATWDENMAGDGAALLQLADAALYRAKREGRNRTVIDMPQAA